MRPVEDRADLLVDRPRGGVAVVALAPAAGLLAARVESEGSATLLMWLRAESLEVVKWAGDPHKAVELAPGEQLTPRASFEAWSETVRGRARAWSVGEVEAAARLADAIAAELKDGKSEVVCDAGKLLKISKDKQGVITREVLTKRWTDWVDYWAVDFNYESRKEIIKVPKGTGINVIQGHLPGQEPAQRELELPATEFEERWTGAYIFENEWQSFRTRQKRELELTSVQHTYAAPGRYTIAVKVIDHRGNELLVVKKLT